MPNPKFQILGPTAPKMVARKSEMQAALSELDRSNPNHVSVIGPRFSGKSVFLKELSEANLPFTATILWDLARFTPEGDEGFRQAFAEALINHPASELQEYRGLLREDSSFSSLKTVFEDIKGRNLSILMLWDGFDRPLERGRYSRNLWDQFLDLISKTPLCLVTATRLSLRQLIRNEDSASSKFWESFGRTIHLRPFSVEDCDRVLELVPNSSFDKGAKSELTNWTGNFAPMYLSLINEVTEGDPASISGTDVNVAAAKVAEMHRDLLADMWADCPSASQEVYGELLDQKECDAGSMPFLDVEPLLLRGLAIRVGPKLRPGCRLVGDFAASSGFNYGIMKQAFGDPSKYAANLTRALAIRISSLQELDARLRTLLQRCLEDIPGDLENCLNQIRGVFDRGVTMLLEAELGSDLALPSALTDPWLTTTEWQRICSDEGHAPTSAKSLERMPRLLLLRLIANPPNNVQRKARRISRTSYEMAQVCKSFGDFGNHTKGEQPLVETAVAALAVAVEFAALVLQECAQAGTKEGEPSV